MSKIGKLVAADNNSGHLAIYKVEGRMQPYAVWEKDSVLGFEENLIDAIARCMRYDWKVKMICLEGEETLIG